MDISSFNMLSLCAGVGGFDLGIKLCVPQARTVCYVEREAYCCEILVQRMQEKCLDEAPVWSDLRTFDGKPWRKVVDCIISGFPCQPFSYAGKQKLESDERYLWPSLLRIISECMSTFVFLENVPGLLPIAFQRIVSDLQSLDYKVAAGIFSTAECGGPFDGKRIYALATLLGQRMEKDWPRGEIKLKRQRRWRGTKDLHDVAFSPFQSRNGWPEPMLRGVDGRVACRMDRLRAIGNGVDPFVGAKAWHHLSVCLRGL